MREALNLTQKSVSEETGLSIRTLTRVEQGDSVSTSILHHLEMFYRVELQKDKK